MEDPEDPEDADDAKQGCFALAWFGQARSSILQYFLIISLSLWTFNDAVVRIASGLRYWSCPLSGHRALSRYLVH